MSSIEQVPVVPQADFSCTSSSHLLQVPIRCPLKGTIKRGTHSKHCSKKSKRGQSQQHHCLALQTGGFEGWKIRRSASSLSSWDSGGSRKEKSKGLHGEVSHTREKISRARFAFCLVQTLWINLSARVCCCFCFCPIRRSITTEEEHYEQYSQYSAAQLAWQKLADDLYQDALCRRHPYLTYQCLLEQNNSDWWSRCFELDSCWRARKRGVTQLQATHQGKPGQTLKTRLHKD